MKKTSLIFGSVVLSLVVAAGSVFAVRQAQATAMAPASEAESGLPVDARVEPCDKQTGIGCGRQVDAQGVPCDKTTGVGCGQTVDGDVSGNGLKPVPDAELNKVEPCNPTTGVGCN